MAGKWVQKVVSGIKKRGTKGALRKQLGAKKDEPIPKRKLADAAKKSGKLGKRARLAVTFKEMKK